MRTPVIQRTNHHIARLDKEPMNAALEPSAPVPPMSAPELQELRDAMPDENDLLDVADVFSLLGDPARLRILVALSTGRLRVRDIAAIAGATESSVSHALRLLRAHRVVEVHRVGREAHYVLADSHVRALLELAMDHVGHSTMIHEVGASHDPASCVDTEADR
jgi:DNA-binding transcriptional ArsR family regulator